MMPQARYSTGVSLALLYAILAAAFPLTSTLAATPALTAHTPATPDATSDTRTGILTLAGGA